MRRFVVKRVIIMKKWWRKTGILLVVMLFLLLSGCGSKPDASDPSTPKESLYPIELFYFAESNGSLYNARSMYRLDKQDGVYTATVKPAGVKEEKTLEIKVGIDFVEQLESILEDHDIGSWNGYDESAAVTDGTGFNLHIILTDQTKIIATGYMEWPEGYIEFADDVRQLFDDLYKKNKWRISWF